MIVKGQAFRVGFDMWNANGTPNSVETPLCEVRQDNGDYAACTNSPRQASDSGANATEDWDILLTAAEMTGDLVTLRATATGCNPTVVRIYTESVITKNPMEETVPGTHTQGTAGYALGLLASGDGTYTDIVVDNVGQAVSGADVRAFSGAACADLKQTVQTDELGSFTLRLPAGDYCIKIDHPDFVEKTLQVTVA